VEQELLTLSKPLSAFPFWVRVAKYLVFVEVFCRPLLFVPFRLAISLSVLFTASDYRDHPRSGFMSLNLWYSLKCFVIIVFCTFSPLFLRFTASDYRFGTSSSTFPNEISGEFYMT